MDNISTCVIITTCVVIIIRLVLPPLPHNRGMRRLCSCHRDDSHIDIIMINYSLCND